MKNILTLLLLCLYFSGYSQFTEFDVHKDRPCPGCPDVDPNWPTLRHYSVKDVNQAFQAVKNAGIEFRYPQGGCQNRAEMMSLALNQIKVEHVRVWLFAPHDLYLNNNIELQIADPNGLSNNNTINWNYHVATCVLEDNNGETDTLVLDPSLENARPLKIKEWLSKINNAGAGQYTFTASPWYFFLTNNNNSVITGEFYKYEQDPRGWINNYQNLTMEKGMAINDVAMYTYQKYIQQLTSDVSAKGQRMLNDLKRLVGNIDAMLAVIAAESSYMGYSVADNLYYRYYWETYTDLMADVTEHYRSQLKYWINKSKSLRQ